MKNHLPAELAAQILEREASENAPDLDPAVRELLVVLAEECGEVVQRCTKILRFGLRVDPWTGTHNGEKLEDELADVWAINQALESLEVTDPSRICLKTRAKIKALTERRGRLRDSYEVVRTLARKLGIS